MKTSPKQRGYFVFLLYRLCRFPTLLWAKSATSHYLIALLVAPVLWALVFGTVLGVLDRWWNRD
jgi:hypothetical protein